VRALEAKRRLAEVRALEGLLRALFLGKTGERPPRTQAEGEGGLTQERPRLGGKAHPEETFYDP
jgi:hypothetical protein